MAYGRLIDGLTINGKPAPYGVINERGVRAAAGIMFLIGVLTLFYIRTTGNYAPLLVVVPLFWLDFLLKTVFSPHLSMFGFLGELAVRKQRPEWVGAAQKRFAWSIGLALSSAMLIVSVFLQLRGWIPFGICITCLTFMWMESALGICAGCSIYGWLLRAGIIATPQHRPACPGGACDL